MTGKEVEKNLKEFHDTFSHGKRPDGEEYVKRDMSKEYHNSMFREMHGTDFMPDDFRYSIIWAILGEILDRNIDWNELEDKDDLIKELEDFSHEMIDGLVPVYNSERADWLASHLGRANYVDDAQEEGLISSADDTFTRLGAGMYKEIEKIFCNIERVIGEELEEG